MTLRFRRTRDIASTGRASHTGAVRTASISRVLVAGVAVLALLLTLSGCDPRPTLKIGSRGADVVTLQQRLTALHYDVGSVDGVFGDSTMHAVVALQKLSSISRDGIVGPQTWSALDRAVTPRPRYNPVVNGYHVSAIEVDLTHQVAYLTYLGAVGRIFDVSTGDGARGAPYTYTPAGSFHVYRINTTGWEYGPLGALYKPAYFYRGYALHGATSVPPNPASHGCVRMIIPSRDRLAEWLWVGMPVYVYGVTTYAPTTDAHTAVAMSAARSPMSTLPC